MDFTHFDEKGRALMVDVTEKNETERCAVATGRILVSRRVYETHLIPKPLDRRDCGSDGGKTHL